MAPAGSSFHALCRFISCKRGRRRWASPSRERLESLNRLGPSLWRAVTAQAHPRAIFNRAIERGSLAIAETTLRELGRPSLCELLELTILIAQKDPRRHAKVSARWLLKYLETRDDATIDDAAFVTACLAALGGDRHAEAASALRAVSKLATSPRRASDVA
jgi:hypothetical protein